MKLIMDCKPTHRIIIQAGWFYDLVAGLKDDIEYDALFDAIFGTGMCDALSKYKKDMLSILKSQNKQGRVISDVITDFTALLPME